MSLVFSQHFFLKLLSKNSLVIKILSNLSECLGGATGMNGLINLLNHSEVSSLNFL